MWYRRAVRHAPAGAVLLLCACTETAPAGIEAVDLDGRRADPLAKSAAAHVLLFVRTDCPISNRYAPEIQRLFEAYRDRGTDFHLIYVSARDTPEAIDAHRREYGLSLPALRDDRHALVRHTGATRTPEAAVIAKGRLVYRGRIDDRFADFGDTRPHAMTRDLADAIDAALSGRSAVTATTAAVGCPISPLR